MKIDITCVSSIDYPEVYIWRELDGEYNLWSARYIRLLKEVGWL